MTDTHRRKKIEEPGFVKILCYGYAMKIMKIPFIIIGTFFPLIGLCNEGLSDNDVDSDKDPVLARIANASAAIQTISSDFLQEKHLDMLKRPTVSQGKFYYKSPDCLRWEILEPVQMGFVVNGDKARRWRGRENRVQCFDTRQEPVVRIITDQVFAWAATDFDWLAARHRIKVLEKMPIALKLTPVSDAEKEHIDHIKLVFSKTDDHVTIVEIHETDGDWTRIRFTNTVINNPIPAHLF